MKKIISGENMVKSYGGGGEKRNVLDKVSVEVSEGEFVAVMGPSGSGKSTLLFAVSGMDRIDSGCVRFDGKELGTFDEEALADLRRAHMGFVFQQPTMLKNLNLLDNILLPAVSGNKKSTAEMIGRAKKLMKKVGIAALEKRNITEVSGGQLQRAGICRALIANPQIIFGDEPTGALNSKAAEEIMEILSRINAEGTAMMLVTHDAKIAARSQRVLFLCDGKIASELLLSQYGGNDLDGRTKKVLAKMQELGI